MHHVYKHIIITARLGEAVALRFGRRSPSQHCNQIREGGEAGQAAAEKRAHQLAYGRGRRENRGHDRLVPCSQEA
jgi:hypothetical protein